MDTSRCCTVIIVLCTCPVMLAFAELTKGIYCQNEEFEAKCQKNEVINIVTAKYGRMEKTRCVERDYGYVGCSVNMTREADKLCSGRHQCSIGIPNDQFDAHPKTCPKDLRLYFEVSYECVPVIPARHFGCSSSGQMLVTSPSGTLASVVTKETQVGSPSCPWVIQAKPGQIIQLTLIDFSRSASSHDRCSVAYAVVSEQSPKTSVNICSRPDRETMVYTSQTHSVTVRVHVKKIGDNAPDWHFLIKYKVIGCALPDLPDSAEISTYKDRMEIFCQNTGKTWQMQCENGLWQGSFDNCTGSQGGRADEVTLGLASLPFGASIVVIVAIAVVLGILILITGLVIIRCRRHQPPPLPPAPNLYQPAGKDASGLPVHYFPSAQIEHDAFYQSSENEYAYIADLPPSSQLHSTPTARHTDFGRKCQDYGTATSCTHAHGKVDIPPQQEVIGQPTNQNPCRSGDGCKIPRYIENVDMGVLEPGSHPPAYFVLDPSDNKKKRVNIPPENIRQNPNGPQDVIVNGHCQSEHPTGTIMKRMNQSIHEFTSCACDHMVDSPENTNHKSV